MLGNEEESKSYRVSLSILENTSELQTSSWCPRAISEKRWGGKGLYVPREDMMWSLREDHFRFRMKIAIDMI